ncbi:hypothetical protein NDU88_005464 [Pleurodeles waltl]|uniref:Uncharacterized protein n=1 Tax=Pleurodeles waltl TaxID=8319 RepID=A0AAV7QHX3_PLEWA|nr:hypothetical protein NDU88_005464 [Pleurodeles waltl]
MHVNLRGARAQELLLKEQNILPSPGCAFPPPVGEDGAGLPVCRTKLSPRGEREVKGQATTGWAAQGAGCVDV